MGLLHQVSQLKYHGTREIPWEAGAPTPQGYLLIVTDSAQYREGTVKSTPVRGVKESLKPCASGRSEPGPLGPGDGVPFVE